MIVFNSSRINTIETELNCLKNYNENIKLAFSGNGLHCLLFKNLVIQPKSSAAPGVELGESQTRSKIHIYANPSVSVSVVG